MSRPFAAFDIDGTIIRWQLYHAVFDHLADAGHISPADYATVTEAKSGWRRRSNTSSFDDYEDTLVSVYRQTLSTIKYSDYMEAVQSAIVEYRDQTYTYTRDLIRQLKKEGYLLFALSGSQQEIVELLATYYEFDDWGGSQYEHDGTVFNGQGDVLVRDKKPVLLRQLVAKHDASWQGSIAIGDSGGDIPMLQIVEQPIAFNPDKVLFDYAQSNNWKVVLERKNMYYELEKTNGSAYTLAQTNAR